MSRRSPCSISELKYHRVGRAGCPLPTCTAAMPPKLSHGRLQENGLGLGRQLSQGYPGEEQFQFPHPTANHVLCSTWMLGSWLVSLGGHPLLALPTCACNGAHEVTERTPDKGLGWSTQRLWVSCYLLQVDSSTVSIRTKWTQGKTFANYNSLNKSNTWCLTLWHFCGSNYWLSELKACLWFKALYKDPLLRLRKEASLHQ